MKLTITIDLDNAAFDGRGIGEELRLHVLNRLFATNVSRRVVKEQFDEMKLRDSNGNTVGMVKVED